MKMYAIFSAEAVRAMKGSRGKLAAQAGHAYLHTWWDSHERFNQMAEDYRLRAFGAAKKIGLVVEDTAQLVELERAYKDVCGVSLVVDAGLTVFKEPTTTCLGIGPIPSHLVGDDIKALKVLI